MTEMLIINISFNTENYFTQYGVSAAMLRVSRAAATCVAMVTTVRHAYGC